MATTKWNGLCPYCNKPFVSKFNEEETERALPFVYHYQHGTCPSCAGSFSVVTIYSANPESVQVDTYPEGEPLEAFAS